MSSVKYGLVDSAFRLMRVNKLLDKKGEAFSKMLDMMRDKQKAPFKIPYSRLIPEFVVEKRTLGDAPCCVVRVRGTRPEKAVLCLFGVGFVFPHAPGDMLLCAEIAKNCSAEVWMPLYPLAPDNKLIDSVRSIHAVYLKMLETHSAENIRFFGTSSGATLALAECMYIRRGGTDIPMPSRLVLQSPILCLPPTAEQRAEMEKRRRLDVVFPPAFFERLTPFLSDGENDWLLSPLGFDLTGFPPMEVFFGTREILIVCLRELNALCRRCDVPLGVHIGKGMMHCWGAMESLPEAAEVRKEYFRLLR